MKASSLLLLVLLAGCAAPPKAEPRDPAVIREHPRAHYPRPY